MMVRVSRIAIWLLSTGCAASPPARAPARPPPAAASKPAPVTPNRAERRARHAQGMAAYDRKDYAACGQLLAQALDHYDAACCYAQAGNADAAFAELALAIDGGYHNASHLAADTDLTSLHADPRWQQAVARVDAAIAERAQRINTELQQLYEQDQADRTGTYEKIDWSKINPRDEARRKRVDEIIAAGGAKAADDYYHAAMVYQHGLTGDEIQRAHDLALKAVELDPKHDDARWLAAAAEDRRLMYDHKPQKWGTQYKKVDGKWIVWPVDPAITDEQREAWNVPPLAEAEARVKQLNAQLPPK